MRAFIVVTDVFRPLVMAQAKVRGLSPRLIVVKHPVGGLNPAELASRIDEATKGFLAIYQDG